VNYDRIDVAIAFRAEHPDDLNPSEATLTQHDAQLFARYDAQIHAEAPLHGIPLTVYNRSKLALFAQLSSKVSPRAQVRDACRYFDAVRPHAVVAHAGAMEEPAIALASDVAESRPALSTAERKPAKAKPRRRT
jgi:hypothetical protein